MHQFAEYFDEDRIVSVSRELTKLYEETLRGSLKEVIEIFENKAPKGEFLVQFRPSRIKFSKNQKLG